MKNEVMSSVILKPVWLKQSRCDENRHVLSFSFITELGYGFSNVSSGSNKNKQVMKWKTDKLSIDLINSVLIITGLFIINDTDIYLSQEVVNQKPSPLTNWWSHWLVVENQWANEGSVMGHGSVFQCFSGHWWSVWDETDHMIAPQTCRRQSSLHDSSANCKQATFQIINIQAVYLDPFTWTRLPEPVYLNRFQWSSGFLGPELSLDQQSPHWDQFVFLNPAAGCQAAKWHERKKHPSPWRKQTDD